MKRIASLHPLLWFVIISMPFVLLAKLQVYPTFDDWNTLSSPNYDPDFLKYFLPYGSIWRPFDALLGYVVSIDYTWFPTLNHIIIFIGHAANTYLIYRLSSELGLTKTPQAIATTIFYCSPCVLATVLACDSLNQTYSQFWGLLAILLYLRCCTNRNQQPTTVSQQSTVTSQQQSNRSQQWSHRLQHLPWMVCIIMSTWAKDNGLAWAVVPPILAFGFSRVDRRTLLRHVAYGLLLAMAYGVVRLSLPHTEIFNPDYHTFDVMKKLKEMGILIGYSFTTGDFICLFHTPSRNLFVFALTLLLGLPLLYTLIFKSKGIWRHLEAWTLLVCAVIAVSPNILISLSIMNAYASLGMIALLAGWCAMHVESKHLLTVSMACYLVAAVAVGVHTWYMSMTTSEAGPRLARQAIDKTGDAVDNVYMIIVEDDVKKFSSFCVPPAESFGWGIAAMHETGYVWPKTIDDTIMVHATPAAVVDSVAHQALDKGYDCVWIYRDDTIDVLK